MHSLTKAYNLVTDWAKKDFDTFTYTFAADGTFTLTDSYETESGTYTFKDGALKLMWGSPDDYDIYKASVINGVLIFEEDYTEGCDDLQLDDLIQLGIGNPTEFTVRVHSYKSYRQSQFQQAIIDPPEIFITL